MVTFMTSKKMAGGGKSMPTEITMREDLSLACHRVEGCIDGQTGQSMRANFREDFDQVEGF